MEEGIFLIGGSRFTSATWIPLPKAAVSSWLLKGSLFSLWIIQTRLPPAILMYTFYAFYCQLATSPAQAKKKTGAKPQIGSFLSLLAAL